MNTITPRIESIAGPRHTPRSTPSDEPRADESRADETLAAWKPGVALAGLGAVASFQKSLVPRERWQQAAATAIISAAAFGIGTGTAALANRVDRASSLDQTTSKLAVVGAGIGTALAATVALRGRASLPLEALRSSAGVVAGVGALALAVQAEQSVVGRVDDAVPGGSLAAHGAIAGAAALGTGALILHKPRAGAPTAEAMAAFDIATRSLTPGGTPLDAARQAMIVAERSRMTTVSGGEGSLLPRVAANGEAFGKEPPRFVDGATPPEEIARTMGVPLDQVQAPVRVYGGMHHAANDDEFATRVLDEAIRLGAFDRSHVQLYLPSGTGHVNPIAAAALEYLSKGDVASIAMQYGDLPSAKSLGKIGDAARRFDAVRATFAAHIASLPEATRPTMASYGESLGAWSMQKAIRSNGGPSTVRDQGLTHNLGVGTPGFSPLRTEAVGRAGHRLSDDGTVLEVGTPAELAEHLAKLTPEQRAKITTYLYSHHEDPVNKGDLSTFVRRPDWLANASDGLGVPRTMKWIWGVTGVHNLLDVMNGIGSGPGFARRAHDYRDDIDEVLNIVHGAGATPAQLQRMSHAFEQFHLAELEAARAADAAAAAPPPRAARA